MKASDFFIGTRQLFGFLLPGALWIAAWMLIQNMTPVTYLTGEPWIPNLLLFIGLSYVIGFVVQTWIFALIMEYQEWRHRSKSRSQSAANSKAPPPVPKEAQENAQLAATGETEVERYRRRLVDAVEKDLSTRPAGSLEREKLPRFCKNFVLENSTNLRDQILELEGEINLMVGVALPLVFLSVAWMNYEGGNLRTFWPAVAGALAASLYFLFRRVPKLREGEELMWCEMYLILRSRDGAPANKTIVRGVPPRKRARQSRPSGVPDSAAHGG